MKKVLLFMSVVAAISFSSCSSKKDCDCVLKNDSGDEIGTLAVTEHDGDCSDFETEEQGFTWKCEEK